MLALIFTICINFNDYSIKINYFSLQRPKFNDIDKKSSGQSWIAKKIYNGTPILYTESAVYKYSNGSLNKHYTQFFSTSSIAMIVFIDICSNSSPKRGRRSL